jgi:nucleoside-diphosphate-sugar epimerase
MRLLITGGFGHIGSRLLLYLGKLDYIKNIVVLDSMVTQRFTSLFNLPFDNKISVELGDARQLSLNSWVFQEKIDLIIHLAALTEPSYSYGEPEKLFENNFEATSNIVNLCKLYGVPLIFPSTTSVYSPKNTEGEVFESEPSLYGGNPYSITKIAEEELIKSATGLKFVILRLATVFGKSPGIRFHTAVNKLCLQAALGKNLTVWTTALKQMRPYLALGDLESSINHIIKNSLYDSQIYNLVSTNSTIMDIITIIENTLKENVKLEFVDSEVMNNLSFAVSNLKFTSTSFRFTGNLNEGITETLDLFKGVKR